MASRPERDDGESEARAEEPETTALSGRLQVDGYAPYRGQVRVRTEEEGWSRMVSIDRYGRFYLPEVPATRLLLDFTAEHGEERNLLLPDSHEVTFSAGAIQYVDLDWRTRQVNVLVTGQAGEGPGTLQVLGPGYSREVSLLPTGRTRLSLVGEGRFRFSAELDSGEAGAAEAEIDEDELYSVVIDVSRSP